MKVRLHKAAFIGGSLRSAGEVIDADEPLSPWMEPVEPVKPAKAPRSPKDEASEQ